MNKQKVRFIFLAVLLGIILITGKSNISKAAATKSINITNLTMSKGQTKQLKVSGVKKVSWKSSNKSIVSISKEGKLKANKKGTATITATAEKKTYKCTVTVNQPSKKEKDILIVYFSQTGTTKAVANKIQKLTGGDLLQIKEKSTYPKDYDKCVARAEKELKKDSRPAITTVAANMKSYDVIYIGFPIWWHTTPKVIHTFVEQYNLKGKTVIPFCTSGGSDIEEAMPVINKMCTGATILNGYTSNSGSTSEIRKWLRSIGQLPSDNSTTNQNNNTNRPSNESEVSAPTVTGNNALVLYFSMPETNKSNNMTQEEENSTVVVNGSVYGNTQYLAMLISNQTGADLFRIEPDIPYTTNHSELVTLAKEEQNNNARPSMKEQIKNFAQYDTIFIGYPIWWSDFPMIMYTLFDNYDMSGKTVIPFSTHGGSGLSGTISILKQQEPNANIIENALSISRSNMDGCESTVTNWLKEIGY